MPDPELIVRPCFEQDLEQVQLIYAHHVRTGAGSLEIDPPDLREITDRWSRIVGRGWPWLVASPVNDLTRVSGYAYATQFRDRPGYAHTFEDSVYVAPGSERRGVGLALLAMLVVELESVGARQVVAVIGGSDNAASIGVHTRCGFARVGTLWRAGWKFGRWHDVIFMQREIVPKSSS